jgi:hypothetical protein
MIYSLGRLFNNNNYNLTKNRNRFKDDKLGLKLEKTFKYKKNYILEEFINEYRK